MIGAKVLTVHGVRLGVFPKAHFIVVKRVVRSGCARWARELLTRESL